MNHILDRCIESHHLKEGFLPANNRLKVSLQRSPINAYYCDIRSLQPVVPVFHLALHQQLRRKDGRAAATDGDCEDDSCKRQSDFHPRSSAHSRSYVQLVSSLAER